MSIDDLISKARQVCEINRSIRNRFLETGDQNIFDSEAGLRCEKDAKVFEEIAGALEELKSYRARIFSGDMTKRMIAEEEKKIISEFAEKEEELLKENSFSIYTGGGDYNVVTLSDAMDAISIIRAEMNEELGVWSSNKTLVLHELKILPKYYDEVISGKKRFELRKDDRDFQVGDTVSLKEFEDGKYSGREKRFNIKYILRNCPEYGLKDGYCILGW